VVGRAADSPCVTTVLARIGRFEPPVEYREIYPRLQRVRTVGAVTIVAISIWGAFLAIPYWWLPATAGAVAAGHAVVRNRIPDSGLESLLVDVVAAVVGLGLSSHAHIGYVAVAAYIIAGAVTFAGLRALLITLTVFAAGVALRPIMPLPGPLELPAVSDALIWAATAVFLGGVALSLMAAASQVYLAKRMQAEALETERRASEMRTEFVSMVTHELRTPLTTISGFGQTLTDSWRNLPAEDVDEFLHLIVSESDHLRDLVEDLLTIPRLEAGKLLLDTTDFQLQPAAFKIANLLFPEDEERSASVTVGSNVVVHADPNRVEQVLRNLIENARKYGGESVAVEAIRHDDHWKIVVADDGAGLPEKARERIFGAFEQASAGDARSSTGVGLGLAVASHLVEAMGGQIWYEPGFPVGARFCFTLPAAKGDQLSDVA